MTIAETNKPRVPWYAEITPYQWLVLLIACLGWVFDAYEGQIFVASTNEAMPSLLPAGTSDATVYFYNQFALGMFLLGGAVGGVLFGILSDRIGRTRAMVLTILMYSCFTGLTAFVQTWWQMAALRFLVAMGVGGEWAVASAMVAEVFPTRARAYSLAIFHSSSIAGIYLAVLAGVFVVGDPRLGWRYGFALGMVPALLTVWIRSRLREPEAWLKAREAAQEDHRQQTGKIGDLFAVGLVRNTLVGATLATMGLGTFWGVHIYGKELYRERVDQQFEETERSPAVQAATPDLAQERSTAVKHAEMLGMFLVTTGSLLGLLSFGPISERLGRRGAFLLYLLGGMLSTWAVFLGLSSAPLAVLGIGLVVFGFLTGGFHSGFAIYFPELFPTRLRGTGAGFCFNSGRLLAAPILVVVAWMRDDQGLSLASCASWLAILFPLGALALLFARETKGQELPE